MQNGEGAKDKKCDAWVNGRKEKKERPQREWLDDTLEWCQKDIQTLSRLANERCGKKWLIVHWTPTGNVPKEYDDDDEYNFKFIKICDLKARRKAISFNIPTTIVIYYDYRRLSMYLVIFDPKWRAFVPPFGRIPFSCVRISSY